MGSDPHGYFNIVGNDARVDGSSINYFKGTRVGKRELWNALVTNGVSVDETEPRCSRVN